jgi:hypothetical protein
MLPSWNALWVVRADPRDSRRGYAGRTRSPKTSVVVGLAPLRGVAVEKMSREATFRQNDITRALRAAGAAGCAVRRIEINRDGKIILVLTEPPDLETKADSSEIVL